MNKTLLTLFTALLFSLNTLAQNCEDCRYISPVFDSVTVETVQFGQGMNIDGVNQDLFMDVYQPYGDTVTDRPVIIFAFGGGFVQGSREDWYVVEVCKNFAKAGYVAVANDYRIGIDPAEIIALQHMRIFFRPMQDMRATVQYLKADYSELGNNYNIDTNKIIVGGASAGAITALMHTYCDKESEMAQMAGGDISALDDLGGFNSTTGFYPNYNWEGVAAINVSGALIDADWIEPGDPPVISAHGDADDVVPYASGSFGGITLGLFDLEGSYLVDSVANAKGVCSYLYTMENQGHPSESMGIDYILSVVHRMSQRAYAVINENTFCCDLEADVEPNDTLFYAPGDPTTDLSVTIMNDTGNVDIKWCSIGCGYAETTTDITFQPDTAIEFLSVTATEGNCQASDLYILTDSTVVPESIFEHEWKVDFSVFPNPSSEFFRIDADLQQYPKLQVDIYNFEGKLTYQESLTQRKTVNVQHLATGKYLVLLRSENEILGAERLVIAR